jgi:tetratricopeptide (TPR) repeat protein/nucleoside phosphorylase
MQEAFIGCKVLIVVGREVTHRAVVAHLSDAREVRDEQSREIYTVGSIAGKRVAVAWVLMGASAQWATWQASRAFCPRVIFFVGMAAGLADVSPGDVLVATRVCAYEYHRPSTRVLPRRQLWHEETQLCQHVRAQAKGQHWWESLEPDRVPQVHLGMLAVGEDVVDETRTGIAGFLRTTYRDVLGVDLTGYGFLEAVHTQTHLPAVVICGVANDLDEPSEAFCQEVAARHAAAFACEVIATLSLGARRSRPASLVNVPWDRNPCFTGRSVYELRERLRQQKTVVLVGPGGIGKTQLALEYAYFFADDYRYILWVNALSRSALTASYVELARTLDLPEQETGEGESMVEAVKDWLQQQQGWLLIVDQAEQLDLLPAFLPATKHGHVLITTRDVQLRTLADEAAVVMLARLAEEAGAWWLLRRSGLLAADATLDQAQEEVRLEAKALAQAIGGLPLALSLVGAYVQTTGSSLAEVAAQWASSYEGDEPVAHAVALSLRQIALIDPAAADLLRLAAIFAPEEIPEAIVTVGAKEGEDVLADVAADPLRLDAVLDCLCASGLLTRDPEKQTLHMPRRVQSVVCESMSKESQRDHWRQRAANAVHLTLERLKGQDEQIGPGLWPHVLVCASWVADELYPEPERAGLLQEAADILAQQRCFAEAEQRSRRALSIWAERAGVRAVLILSHLASVCQEQGKAEEAEQLYRRALAVSEEPEALLASSLNNLGVLVASQGRYAEAEGFYQRALSLLKYQRGERHPDTARCLSNLAVWHEGQSQYAEAEALYRRALAILEEQLGAGHTETVRCLSDLAELLYKQQRGGEAEPFFQRVLASREQVLGWAHPDTALTVGCLAAIQLPRQCRETAAYWYWRALSIYERACGPEHPTTQQIRQGLVAFLVESRLKSKTKGKKRNKGKK